MNLVRAKEEETDAMATKRGKRRRNNCNACEVRARAGFDGLCPVCASERTRRELAFERVEKKSVATK